MKKQSPSSLQINNGRVILRSGVVKGASIFIESGKIKRVGKFPQLPGVHSIDAKGLFVSPGFIDSHIHGDPAKVLTNEIKYGTTAIVPAISCDSPEKIERAVASIARFKEESALGSSVPGLRIEGPYISKEKAGAQNKRYIKPPSAAGLRGTIGRSRGLLKIVTLAPELEGAKELIGILCKNKVIASMGHTNADYRDSLMGIEAGITHATHLFNGMRGIVGDDAGAALACLADKRITVEVIADLIHVSGDRLRLMFAMKPKDKIVLITDSVRAERPHAFISGGVYRLRDGTIAGSHLTMIEAIKRVFTACDVPLIDAVNCATLNPAKLLGVDGAKGSLARGKDADIVIFDKNFDVKMTIVHGRIVYRKRGF